MKYADAGVDIDIEEKAAKLLYAAAKKSWTNRQGQLGEVIMPFDDFSGIRAIDVSLLPAGTVMNIGFDGIGTKAEFAEAMGKYDTLAYDLMAMVCDDAVIRGGEPVLVGSILDVNSLGKNDTRLAYIKQIAKGYTEAAAQANVAIINGEIAQLGDRIGLDDQFALSWGASVVWFGNKDRLITGHDVKVGDAIIGFEEPSLRSNGISLVRRVLTKKLGKDWHHQKLGNDLLGNLALEPSTIYAPAVVEMFGGWNEQPVQARLHAVANVTGSGLPGKLGRALKPSGLGATIDAPFKPPKLMAYCQEIGSVRDDEAYRTWHMGQGMVVVSPDPSSVIKIANKHRLNARVIGVVTKETGIRINSCGYFNPGRALAF